MKELKVLSLFDGISGGQIALNRCGYKIKEYYASEVDQFSIKVTQTNYPNTIQIGDVSKVTYEDGILYTENGTFEIGQIDLLLFGSPCQSFTFAGKRQGMATDNNIEVTSLDTYLDLKEKGYSFVGQSYLFWEACRILKETNPTYFMCENVKMASKWERTISEALGVEPNKINSNLLSAQNRNRLYWTNINDGVIPMPEHNNLFLKDIVEENVSNKYELSETHMKAFLKSYNWKPCSLDGKAKPLLATYYKQPPHSTYIPSENSSSGYRRLTPLECERLQTLPENYTDVGISDTQRYKGIGNGWTISIISHILSYM